MVEFPHRIVVAATAEIATVATLSTEIKIPSFDEKVVKAYANFRGRICTIAPQREITIAITDYTSEL